MNRNYSYKHGIGGLLVLIVLLLAACSEEPQNTVSCTFINDILLINGKIITVDENDRVVSSLRIVGDRIVALGADAGVAGICTQTIDLGGRTVIPGLIDHHNHWVSRASRPGHHVAKLDSAFSIDDVLSMLREKADELDPFESETPSENITANDFITSIGAFDPLQFTEGRMPTLEELDTIDHPVFLSMQFDGPSRTNSAGKRYFEARGITVGPATVEIPGPIPSPRPAIRADTIPGTITGTVQLGDGQIAQGPSTFAARAVLAKEHDFDDLVRGTVDTMVWSASVGLTMSMDEGGNSFEAFRYLEREGRAITRLRVSVNASDLPVAGVQDRVEPPEDAVPNLAALASNAIPNLGNDMYRVVQMGESIAPMGHPYGTDPIPSNYDEATRVVAKYQWSLQQHSIALEQAQQIIGIWEQTHEEYPIDDLRWSLGHIFDLGIPEFDRLHAMGAGAALHSLKYTTHTYAPGIIPYRTAYNHPIHAAAGTDGGNITTINPWNALYFMTTGLNSAGEQVLGLGEDGETVTRRQALEMYTRDAAWFSFDEEKLGSLEVNKLADMVILSEDYDTVSDEDLRQIHSVLTIVNGDIVYSNSHLLTCAGSSLKGIWFLTSAEETCRF